MRAKRRRFFHALTLATLAFPTLTTLVGCEDETRKGGTQVQESEQTKAMVEDMRKTYEQRGAVK